MSFNLGNWWEKLNLDILKDWLAGGDDEEGGVPPDLDLPEDYHDPEWDDPDPYDLTEPAPDPHERDPFEGIDPHIPLPGDGRADPSWDDGPGIDFSWPFTWP